eukprot:6229366-Ditylum_brightwellii.AAC.1
MHGLLLVLRDSGQHATSQHSTEGNTTDVRPRPFSILCDALAALADLRWCRGNEMLEHEHDGYR